MKCKSPISGVSYRPIKVTTGRGAPYSDFPKMMTVNLCLSTYKDKADPLLPLLFILFLRRASRSCRKSVWERPRKSDASQDEKIFFCFYHLVEKIRSFPTMYNTWGCLWGQIDETKHFLQKKWSKNTNFGGNGSGSSSFEEG